MGERVRTAVIWVLCMLLLLPGLGVAVWIVSAYVRELRNFQPVEATIIASGVGDGPGRGANYHPVIDYEYYVNRCRYKSNRFRAAYWKSDYKWGPQSIVDRYPPGSKHTAWYDPANPAVVVLERSLNWIGLLIALAVGALPICGLLAHHFWLKPPATPPSSPESADRRQ
jgi:hypothetical protein